VIAHSACCRSISRIGRNLTAKAGVVDQEN
jgi:hypothetical protein